MAGVSTWASCRFGLNFVIEIRLPWIGRSSGTRAAAAPEQCEILVLAFSLSYICQVFNLAGKRLGRELHRPIGVPPAVTVALLLQARLPLAIGGWYSWRGSRLERA